MRLLRHVIGVFPTSVGAFLVAAGTPVLMRLDLERLRLLLEPPRQRSSPSRADVATVSRAAARGVRAVGRLRRLTCVPRGTARYWALRRAGFDVELCFGIARTGTSSDGHCWLVLDGQPLSEPSDPEARFVPMVRLSRTGLA